MSLDKAIAHGRERRAPYYGSKRIDPACRPGGSCPWCRENRAHQHRRELERTRVNDVPDPRFK